MFNNVLIYGHRLKFASFVLHLLNLAHIRFESIPQDLLPDDIDPQLLYISKLSCQITFMMQVLEDSTLGHEIIQEDSELLNSVETLQNLIKTKNS